MVKGLVLSVDAPKEEHLFNSDYLGLKAIGMELGIEEYSWNISSARKGWGSFDFKNKLNEKIDEPFIIVNSSGFFHNRTFYFLRDLVKNEDVAYIHIDSHPDLHGKKDINYSNFVGHISNLGIDSYLLGITPDKDLLSNSECFFDRKIPKNVMPFFSKSFSYYLNVVNDKWYPKLIDKIRKKVPENLVSDFNPENIAQKNVYVSIDLDVLRDFPSAWSGHGQMNINGLEKILDKIGATKNIVGADICGVDFNLKSSISSAESLYTLNQVYPILEKAIALSYGNS